MEIYLAPENAYYFVPRFSVEIAHDRVEQKKNQLVAGTVGALLSRPKPEEIQMAGVESRYEPFWLVAISAHTTYDRSRTYTVSASGPEVRGVTALGQDLTVEVKGKEAPRFTFTGVEHCSEEGRASHTFDGLSGEKVDMSKYLALPKTVIVDLEHFAPEGALVIPPQVTASAVVRQVMSEVIKPVQQAHIIHEERVNVEALDLHFRPVYALEYEWGAKGKRSIIEFDALNGDIRTGRKLGGESLKGIVTRDLLFDLTADAVGIFVPGGGMAVKLVKAVVDRSKAG